LLINKQCFPVFCFSKRQSDLVLTWLLVITCLPKLSRLFSSFWEIENLFTHALAGCWPQQVNKFKGGSTLCFISCYISLSLFISLFPISLSLSLSLPLSLSHTHTHTHTHTQTGVKSNFLAIASFNWASLK